jgi:hypothetical protein
VGLSALTEDEEEWHHVQVEFATNASLVGYMVVIQAAFNRGDFWLFQCMVGHSVVMRRYWWGEMVKSRETVAQICTFTSLQN